MSRILVLYWAPGSGGDLVQSLLLTDSGYQGAVAGFSASAQGRVIPTIDDRFLELFAQDQEGWYAREWTDSDCELIGSMVIGDKTLILPTHDLRQVDFLRSRFGSCMTVGLTYLNSFFPLVLKNWCRKVGFDDVGVKDHYNLPWHQNLRRKGVFGQFLLGEQLRFGSRVPHSVDCGFDVCINLEDLYVGECKSLLSLMHWQDRAAKMYQRWLDDQSLLHRYRYPIVPALSQALGINHKAAKRETLEIALDGFDYQLIKHYCRQHGNHDPVPAFSTLGEANVFFYERFGR